MTVRALSLLVAALLFAGSTRDASAAGVPARAHSVRSRATTHATARSSSHATAARDSARTLDAIHIEGELDVPEVLFITARDQRRIVEFQHRRYLGTSAQALHATPSPTRLVVDRRGPAASTSPAPAPENGGVR